MKIVNIHHYGDAKDAERAGCVIVARPSLLGNPYSHLDGAKAIKVATRSDAIEQYRIWLWEQIKQENAAVLMWLMSLREDSTLACYCAPKSCHAEVIEKAWRYLIGKGYKQTVLFWSGAPRIEERILSNFWMCEVKDDEGRYSFHSSEQAYFYLLCANEYSRKKILSCGDARAVKKASKTISRVDASWDEGVMAQVLEWKFRDPDLAKVLKDTGDAELIHYCAWGDTKWGVDKEGKGQNLQGKLLMNLRSKL